MNKMKWAANRMPKTDDKQLAVMSGEEVRKARQFHESFPQARHRWLSWNIWRLTWVLRRCM